mgnify:CR=1 FL=1
MRVALLGAGLQAQAACFDLIAQPDVSEIVVADAELARAQALARRWGDPRVKPVAFDAGDLASAREVLRGAKAALSAVPYKFNLNLARAAVAERCSFCDLGGNNDVVNATLALDAEARAAGVTLVPDCGLAPGMTQVLVADAVPRFERCESVQVRVGGLPQKRGGLLDYSLLFNIQGLINEYVEDAVVLRAGRPQVIPSLDDFETLEFPPPFGTLEAFTTSGGTSTLPETYAGKVQELSYKTIRYPGHGRVFQALKQLGLLSWEPKVEVDGAQVSPRALFSKLAEPALDRGEPDVALVRVTARGQRGGEHVTRIYQLIEYPAHGLTAMMRMTAFPATIVQMMLARGQIVKKGALPQERCVDPGAFMALLGEKPRELKLEVREE